MDGKKPLDDESGIEVVDVTEILEDVTDCQTSTVDELPVTDAIQSTTRPRITCKETILRILQENGKAHVARPDHQRAYMRNLAFKKLAKKYVINKLRPHRPTTSCKRYLHYRMPYRSPDISFHLIKSKYLKRKPPTSQAYENVPDTSVLPLTYEAFVEQIEIVLKLFLEGEAMQEIKPEDPSGADIVDVKGYKSRLISRLNTNFCNAIISQKTDSVDFHGFITCTNLQKRMFSLQINTDSWEQYLPFRTGLRISIEVGKEEIWADVTQTLRFEGKFKMTVILVTECEKSCDWNQTDCTVKQVALIGHLLLQAKAILMFEHFHIHTQFIHPVINSKVSNVPVQLSEGFFKTYQNDSFFSDSIQKIVDTCSLNQSDVSSICVVEDVNPKEIRSLFLDSVKYLLRNEADIVENLREVSEIVDHPTLEESLKIVIVSHTGDALQSLAHDLGRGNYFFYQPIKRHDPSRKYSMPRTEQLIDCLSKQIEKSNNQAETDRLMSLLTDMKEREYRSEEYETAKKLACDVLLQCSSIVIGTIPDLLNDEHISYMLAQKLRKFDIAIVHEASALHDSDLISLMLFGVQKMILFSVTARDNLNYTIAHRMISKAARSAFDSHSPVLDRSVYLQRLEEVEKDRRDRRRASAIHAHSFRSHDPKLTYRDTNELDSHRRQAQAVRPRPSLPDKPRGGRGGADSRGRGRERGYNFRGASGFRGGRGGGGHPPSHI